MRSSKRPVTARLLAGAATLLIVLLLCCEFSFLLVRPGMTGAQVESLLGRHDFVDILSGVPPEQGHGTYYYARALRPHLIVEWGPDQRVRKIHY